MVVIFANYMYIKRCNEIFSVNKIQLSIIIFRCTVKVVD